MMEPTPLRPDEQVAGGFLVLRLGRDSFNVKVLPMRDSRKWLETAKGAIRSMRGTAEGLEPDALIVRVQPEMIDVSSGVESAPGYKDADKLREFFAAVAAA